LEQKVNSYQKGLLVDVTMDTLNIRRASATDQAAIERNINQICREGTK
jgi:hypothetical protein